MTYTEHPDHTIHATAPGNVHELVWHPDPGAVTGNVTLDNQTRPMGLHLSSDKFHVQAETFFGVKHEPPASLVEWIQREAASKRCSCDGDRVLCVAHTETLRVMLAGGS